MQILYILFSEKEIDNQITKLSSSVFALFAYVPKSAKENLLLSYYASYFVAILACTQHWNNVGSTLIQRKAVLLFHTALL